MLKPIRFVAIVVVVSATLVRPAAAQVDTDGDGLLDLIDVPGFDPSARSTEFSNQGIQDLDGVNLLIKFDWLDISDNQITSLDSGDFDGLTTLWGLVLYGNHITSLESGDFKGLDKLEWLDLSGNQITSLESGDFDGLSQLRALRLTANPITRLDGGVFHGMTGLNVLMLFNIALTELDLSRSTFHNLDRCSPFDGFGFCIENNFTSLTLDEAELSNRSFDAILASGWPPGPNFPLLNTVSLVNLTFSDEYPSDLSQLLDIETLDNVTVDQSLFDRYADEFSAFAAIDGNTVTVVPEPSTALLLVVGLVTLRRHRRF